MMSNRRSKFSPFSAIGRWIQLIVLVGILILGWFAASVLRLIKGNDWYQRQKRILGVDLAKADVPMLFNQGSEGSDRGSTPFLAIWNGSEYKIENDILFGKPRSYFSSFFEGRREYEAGRIVPDLYKIQNSPKSSDRKLSLQIQEIEPEESFFNGLNLLRVIHPINSELIVDADYRKFYAFDRSYLDKNIVRPEAIIHKDGRDVTDVIQKNDPWKDPGHNHELFFRENDHIDLKFSKLNPLSQNFLIIKPRYRIWLMGEGQSNSSQAKSFANSIMRSRIFRKIASASLLALVYWIWSKPDRTSFLSSFFVLGSGSDSGGGSGGGSHCLQVLYKSKNADHCYISTVEPRAWRYSAEILGIPQGAISNSGEMNLRIFATERHYLGFIGLLEQPRETPCKIETLDLKRAYHHRLQKEVTDLFEYQPGLYLQTIPGDIVDLEFQTSQTKVTPSQKETYLIRTAGFYTYLSPESKKIAGDWEEKVNADGRERLNIIRED